MLSSCIQDELQALEAVLAEDYKLINTNDKDYSYCIHAYCFPSDDLDDCHCSVQISIKIPIKYPKVIPNVTVLSKDGISENTSNNLIKHINNQLNKQINQEMLYNIIDTTREYLKQYNFIDADFDQTSTAQPDDNKNDNQTDPINTQTNDIDNPDDNDINNNDNNGDNADDFGDDFDDEGFDDDDNNDGWSDDIDDDDATFNKSLQTIEKIMIAEQKIADNANKSNKNNKKGIPYDVLKLEDVIDDDLLSPRLLAVADVYRLSMSSKDFYGECRLLKDGTDRYEIRIGIQISKYIQTKTLLNVLGLDDNDYLVIRFEFSSSYINDVQPPKIIEIGKSVPHKVQKNKKKTKNDDKFQPIKLKNKLQSFLGSRSIMNRINNKLFARLWPPSNLNKYFPKKYKEILKLMVMTNYNYDDCKSVLYYLKDYQQSLIYLTTNKQQTNNGNNNNNIKYTPKITDEMKQLCNKLISYGLNELLQTNNTNNNDDDDAKDIQKQNDDSQYVSSHLDKFLLSTCSSFMYNILIEILFFTLHSTLTLNSRCLVCDISFPLSSSSGLIKPTICSNKLCMYGYQELEIGLDIASQIKNNPEIVDLLLTLCYVATKKGKINMFSPINVHGLPPNEHINFKKKWKPSPNPYLFQQTKPRNYNKLDIDLLKKVLNKIPSIDAMLSWSKKGGNKILKKSLSYKSPLLWPLIRWIISSDRSYMIPLRKKEDKFDGLPSCYQFKYISYSPEREYLFNSLSKRNNNCGFKWAWHGSPIANWHCILRTGLKNMSNTSHMVNGAAFGRGIYLAPRSGTSYWYCEASRSDTWPLSMLNKSDYYGRTISTNMNMNNNNTKYSGHGLYILALCQILNHPKLKPPQPYYVVKNESWVMIRYLFVFNTVDNKLNSNYGKGRFFDIEATKCINNYKKKQKDIKRIKASIK